MKIDLHLPMLS